MKIPTVIFALVLALSFTASPSLATEPRCPANHISAIYDCSNNKACYEEFIKNEDGKYTACSNADGSTYHCDYPQDPKIPSSTRMQNPSNDQSTTVGALCMNKGLGWLKKSNGVGSGCGSADSPANQTAKQYDCFRDSLSGQGLRCYNDFYRSEATQCEWAAKVNTSGPYEGQTSHCDPDPSCTSPNPTQVIPDGQLRNEYLQWAKSQCSGLQSCYSDVEACVEKYNRDAANGTILDNCVESAQLKASNSTASGKCTAAAETNENVIRVTLPGLFKSDYEITLKSLGQTAFSTRYSGSQFNSGSVVRLGGPPTSGTYQVSVINIDSRNPGGQDVTICSRNVDVPEYPSQSQQPADPDVPAAQEPAPADPGTGTGNPIINTLPTKVITSIISTSGERNQKSQQYSVGDHVKILARLFIANSGQADDDCLPTEGQITFKMNGQVIGKVISCQAIDYVISSSDQTLTAEFAPTGTDTSIRKMGTGSDAISLTVTGQDPQSDKINPPVQTGQGVEITRIYLEHAAGEYEIYPQNQSPIDLTYENTFQLKVSYNLNGVPQADKIIRTVRFDSKPAAAAPPVNNPQQPINQPQNPVVAPALPPPPQQVTIQGLTVNPQYQWVDKGTTISSTNGGSAVGKSPFSFTARPGQMTISTTVPTNYSAAYAYCLNNTSCPRNFAKGSSFNINAQSGYVDVWWMYTYDPPAQSCMACLPEGLTCQQQCQTQFGMAGQCSYPTSRDPGKCCTCGNAASVGTPPTANVTGPAQLNYQTQTGNYTATATGYNLKGLEVFRIRQGSNFSQGSNFIKIAGSNNNCYGNNCQVIGSWTPSSADNGVWIIVVNGYSDRNNDGLNSIGDNCSGNPQYMPSGWQTCGQGSAISVTVSK